jgi:hypothetical protein
LTGLQRTLYLACDGARSLSSLSELAAGQPGDASAEDVEALLEPLVRDGYMVRDLTSYLSLAVPMGEYRPASGSLERFRALLRKDPTGDENQGTPTEEGQPHVNAV